MLNLGGMIHAICADETTGLPGWCTTLKGIWIADHIIREHLTRCVEIGVFGGRSLIAAGLALRKLGRGGYALGIDPYTFDRQTEGVTLTPHVEWAKDIDYEGIYRRALETIRTHDLQPFCGIVRAAADEIAPLIGPIDFLHIDGCHSVLSSCRDVETYAPKVRPGGLIVLDDCEWETVQAARTMLAAYCEPNPARPEPGWECYRKL